MLDHLPPHAWCIHFPSDWRGVEGAWSHVYSTSVLPSLSALFAPSSTCPAAPAYNCSPGCCCKGLNYRVEHPLCCLSFSFFGFMGLRRSTGKRFAPGNTWHGCGFGCIVVSAVRSRRVESTRNVAQGGAAGQEPCIRSLRANIVHISAFFFFVFWCRIQVYFREWKKPPIILDEELKIRSKRVCEG